MIKLKVLLNLIQSLQVFYDTPPSPEEIQFVFNEAAIYDELIYGKPRSEGLFSMAIGTEVNKNFDEIEWAKPVCQYPFRSPTENKPNALWGALLLDALFIAIDQSVFLRDENGSPPLLRDLIAKYYEIHPGMYDSDFLPSQQSSWIYDGIESGKDFYAFKKSRDKAHDNLNPVGKERHFLEKLLAKLNDTTGNDSSNSLMLFFLLYEMNKGSHALDAVLSPYYHNNYSLFPHMFSVLYSFHLGIQQTPEDAIDYYQFCESVCGFWAMRLSQYLHTSFQTRKDIVASFDMIEQIPYIQSFFKDIDMVALITKYWTETQPYRSPKEANMADKNYYRLIADHTKNDRLTANINDAIQEHAKELSDLIREVSTPMPPCGKENDVDNTNPKSIEEDAMELLERHIHAVNSQIAEAEWKWSKNISEGAMEPNWFGSSNMKFYKPKEEGFGCPLRIFQKPVAEIEAALGNAVILAASDHLLINSDVDNCDCLDNLDEETKEKRDALLGNMARLHAKLSDVARGFYELFIQYELYPVLIKMITSDGSASANGLIPSHLAYSEDNPSKIIWKISPMAEKDGRLHFVCQQSPKRWLSIMETLCSISFGKDAPANSKEEVRCFRCKCGPNKRWRCRKTLAQLLESANS